MASESNISLDRRFQELCTHLRATDDVSFKLLGLVPLFSAAGIATVFFKAEPRLSALVYFISLFAGIVTLALFCWERRNIQICKWLRDRAADLEAIAMGDPTGAGHFVSFPRSPLGIGKTEAEKVVYTVTTVAWLVLPWFIDVCITTNGQVIAVPDWITLMHQVFVWLIGAATVVLALLPVKVEPVNRVPPTGETREQPGRSSTEA